MGNTLSADVPSVVSPHKKRCFVTPTASKLPATVQTCRGCGVAGMDEQWTQTGPKSWRCGLCSKVAG